MKYDKFGHIPKEWLDEMNRLGVKPGDEFFFLVHVLAEIGVDLEEKKRGIDKTTRDSGEELKKTAAVAIRSMETCSKSVTKTMTDAFDVLARKSTELVERASALSQFAWVLSAFGMSAIFTVGLISSYVACVQNRVLQGRYDLANRSAWTRAMTRDQLRKVNAGLCLEIDDLRTKIDELRFRLRTKPEWERSAQFAAVSGGLYVRVPNQTANTVTLTDRAGWWVKVHSASGYAD